MIELHTLGSLELRGTQGESLDSVLVQPKRVALLAYLVLARPRGFQRRDVLLGVFWPESDLIRSRDALNQSLGFLRRFLGKDVLISRGDEIGIDMSRLCCDAISFEERIAAGDDEAGLALYRGKLLEGLFIADAPGFDQWLDSERAKLHEEACHAASRMANECESKGDLGGAVRWARRALELSPFDEPAARRVIDLLDRFGDRASATREYETFESRLIRELEVEPSPETRAVMDAIRARVTPGKLPARERITPLVATVQPRGGELDLTRGPAVSHRTLWIALASITAVMVAVAAFAVSRRGMDPRVVDSSVVTVLPFRVTGTDARLSYLREGMVDLLSATLGESGVARAVDSRTVISAWRRATDSNGGDLSTEAAVRLAHTLGSGRVLLGEVVGAPARVVLTATLVQVPGGQVTARARVEGPADSLTALVDRLAVDLLALATGSSRNRLSSFTSTSLPALKAYLEGQSLYRRGRYGEAIDHFDQALANDSTFALAALGLSHAGSWVDLQAQSRGFSLAWTRKNRLGTRDRAELLLAAGKNYPLPQTGAERIENARLLVRLEADQPEAWYTLGDALFHFGRYVGEKAPEEQSIHAFDQAIRLDSTFSAPMHHLIPMLAERGDTTAVRRLARVYFAIDTIGEDADYMRWRIAAALQDEKTLQAFWSRVNSEPTAVIDWILGAIQKESIRPQDFDRAMAAYAPRGAWWVRAMAMLNRGRPAAADSLLDRRRRDPNGPYPLEQIEIFNALYWDGDAARAKDAAITLVPVISESIPNERAARERYFSRLCTVERWRVWDGEFVTVGRSISRLRGASQPMDAPATIEAARLCALELEAEDAVHRKRPDARRAVMILDSAYRRGPYLDRWTNAANLSIARLFEALGDRAAALAAVRRGTARDIAPQIALSTFLREEGRLAALNGERDDAINAYRRYLLLRSDPEPSVREQVEQTRTALASLIRRKTYRSTARSYD